MAPELDGYEFEETLDSGATAVVYRYRQIVADRDVAVKVSKKRLEPDAAERFRKETTFMARLSAHPYILPVYQAGVTSNGRSFLVVEYAPNGSLKDRIAQGTLNADDMLDMGINLASALAAAHREGIVHRDIKPGNVLITAQGLPALADFGIASSVYDHAHTGFSLAWAPPEVVNGGAGDESGDIYSLAATLYASVVGSSPFEYGYQPSSTTELATCIVTKPVPPMQRRDVPPAVERVLRRAMNPDPSCRYYSAVDFARAMQLAQYESFGHATPTTIEGEPRYPDAVARRMGQMGASGLAGSRPAAGGASGGDGSGHGKAIAITTAVAVLVLALACVFAFVVSPTFRSHSTTSVNKAGEPESSASSAPELAGTVETVPSPANVSGTFNDDGTVTFTWRNPDPQDGDKFMWRRVSSGNDGDATATSAVSTTEQKVSLDAGEATQVCIKVSLVRDSGHASDEEAIGCAVK